MVAVKGLLAIPYYECIPHSHKTLLLPLVQSSYLPGTVVMIARTTTNTWWYSGVLVGKFIACHLSKTFVKAHDKLLK